MTDLWNPETKTWIKSPYDMLLEFHKTFGAAINQPLDVSLDAWNLVLLRDKLIREECHEVQDELFPDSGEPQWSQVDKKKLTKELADLMYVTIGTAVTFGLPLEEVFAEVHKSNMSKLGEDGNPIVRSDGKVLKGPNYKEPNLDQYFE